MPLLAIVGLVLVGLVVIFLAVVALQPSAFRVERSAEIKASPGEIVLLLQDFHAWQKWSPWEHLDPNMKRTFSGPAAGPGAVYAWAGNKKAGEGRMTILQSTPEVVALNLEFIKPWQATNRVEFRLVPAGDSTRVTWSMTGTKNFVFKAFGLVMSMDKLVGGDFERGLKKLGEVAKK